MPKSSVIIPSYNHAAYLREGLDSILGQTFQDWEVVLTDDCSTDDSYEIAKAYTDPRIRAYRNESNLGTYGNQNRGLELATGEFIAIMNSDDYWEPTKLEKQVAMLEKYPQASLCYSYGDLLRGTERETAISHHADYPTTELHDIRPWLIVDNRVLASSVLYRIRPSFRPDFRYSGDWVQMLKSGFAGPFAFVAESLSVWRMHESNASSETDRHFLEEIRIRNYILDHADRFLEGSAEPEIVRRNLGECCKRLYLLYLQAGDRAAASRAISRVAEFTEPDDWTKKHLRYRLLPIPILRSRVMKGRDCRVYEERYRAARLESLEI